jgi:anthranilate/para-aminobenzoate synthase component I
LAGTRKRGKDAEEDMALEKCLLSDEKEIAEHVMLVDLGRNDVGKVTPYLIPFPNLWVRLEPNLSVRIGPNLSVRIGPNLSFEIIP